MVHYDNGDEQFVVPPIVEERNQLLYLGDGMHRMFTLLNLNISTAYVLITHECTLPFPGIPQAWQDVTRCHFQLPCYMNFENFLRTGLTGYSKFCNSNIFWKGSKE